MQEQMVRTTCNAEGARQLGMNHAREGMELDPSFVGFCPDHQDELLLKSYREGYEAGVQTFGSDNFHCSAAVHGRTYAAFGSTELEARTRVDEQCRMAGNSQACERAMRCSRQRQD